MYPCYSRLDVHNIDESENHYFLITNPLIRSSRTAEDVYEKQVNSYTKQTLALNLQAPAINERELKNAIVNIAAPSSSTPERKAKR